MADPRRVKDKDTGHEFTTRREALPENWEVVKNKRAVDARGRDLPAKPKTSVAKKATASKTSGGEPAGNPEEGSK
jgi:hypothetical protein